MIICNYTVVSLTYTPQESVDVEAVFVLQRGVALTMLILVCPVYADYTTSVPLCRVVDTNIVRIREISVVVVVGTGKPNSTKQDSTR